MEPNYIQLPPLPSDMPTDLIEIIWGFARMEEPERKKFLDFMRENMKPGVDNGKREELLRMMEKSRGEASPYVEEFHSLMRDLIGTLVAQACEMAALVLQYYCVDEKSIKEISEKFDLPEDTVELMTQYYERKINHVKNSWDHQNFHQSPDHETGDPGSYRAPSYGGDGERKIYAGQKS